MSHLGKLAIVTTMLLSATVDCIAAPATLPPNWTSGGKAREELRPKRKPKIPSETPKTDEADFQPDVSRVAAKQHTLGLWAAIPELARAEYRFSISPHLALFLTASGPMPIDVNVSMPSDVIKADQQKGLAVAYPAFDIKFKVDWGPHVFAGAAWHPFGGGWYTSFAAGLRSLKIKGSASSPMRICSIIEAAKEPPCGNDSAAIQTRNSIALKANVSVLSVAARAATGWVFNISSNWALLMEAGVFVPAKTTQTTGVTTDIVAPDGTPEDLSGALGELRSKSQSDLAEKAKAELGRVTSRTLPVLGIGIGYRF